MAEAWTVRWAPSTRLDTEPVGTELMLPGRASSCESSLLARTTLALQAAAWAVLQAGWTLPTLPEAPRSFVEGTARLLDRTKRTPGPVLVVAKSLGTLSAHWAAERGYPAVWLTPPLKAVGLHPMPTESRELAHRLRSYPEASLTVGGMADDLWSPGFRSTGQVLEIPGADHQLEDTDRRPSVRRHEEVAAAVAQFATGLLEE